MSSAESDDLLFTNALRMLSEYGEELIREDSLAINWFMQENSNVNHRTKSRFKCNFFDYERALQCNMEDYFCPETLFNDFGFKFMCQISRQCFMEIHDDIRATGNNFFFPHLLLPSECLDYGVAPHAFCDYFQCSKSMAKTVMEELDKAVMPLYLLEYLRKPTMEDLNSIQ